jgi:phosphoribosylformimino-5-aminoimidazole carboxamide ribotide isomerase
MKIIPAIDIIGGQCVRLVQGSYDSKKIYHKNPVEQAKIFEDHGIRHLHLVDLDGAKSDTVVHHKILSDIARQTQLHIDFGGGIKNDQAIRMAFESGAHQVTCGSIAATHPERVFSWLQEFGPEKIILGADAKKRKIMTHGWYDSTDMDVVEYIRGYTLKGIKYVICTDIDKDGMLEGCAEDLYEEILQQTTARLIASGGVSSLSDIENLKRIGCEGVIIGKALYEGKITMADLIPFIH